GTEVVLPIEVALGSARGNLVDQLDPLGLELDRWLDLDIAEEVRYGALLQSTCYQQSLRCHTSKLVRPRELRVGDLVLRCIQHLSSLHKLPSRWDGPFTNVTIDRTGAYRLVLPDGQSSQTHGT